MKLCDQRCNEHGQCKNGTCLCVTGWNGKHCTLEGCPNLCSGHGQCRVNVDNAWECQCSDGWFGRDCSVQLELNCNDGRDNDKGKLRSKIYVIASLFSRKLQKIEVITYNPSQIRMQPLQPATQEYSIPIGPLKVPPQQRKFEKF